MRPLATVWRRALGWVAATGLVISLAFGTAFETPALASASGLASVQKMTPMTPHLDLNVTHWAAKKKKRKVKTTDPDTLPQPMISIIPGSTINLLSRSSKLPIVIKNGYPVEVRVRVRVQASNLKVLIPDVVEVVVPANTTVTAKVPVSAIANGDVTLHATLESFSGIALTMPVDIKMVVILGVEDTVLYGFLSFVALLVALGAFRTVRKRRREAAARADAANNEGSGL